MRSVRDNGGRKVPVLYQRRRFRSILDQRRSEEAAELVPTRSQEPAHKAASVASRTLDWILASLLAIPLAVAAIVASIAFAATFLGIIVLPVYFVGRAAGLSSSSMHLFVAGGVLCVLVGAAIVHTFAWPKRNAAELARWRLCGACAYSLVKLPSGEDGTTVCPECGSAWRVPPPHYTMCAVCSSSLRGCEVDTEGLVHCPECEAPHTLSLLTCPDDD
ncbi:MAG: hypothetical protein ACF8R9_08630 [Phycisphaerales bacterium JB054]